jgi:hypothetical protein
MARLGGNEEISVAPLTKVRIVIAAGSTLKDEEMTNPKTRYVKEDRGSYSANLVGYLSRLRKKLAAALPAVSPPAQELSGDTVEDDDLHKLYASIMRGEISVEQANARRDALKAKSQEKRK